MFTSNPNIFFPGIIHFASSINQTTHILLFTVTSTGNRSMDPIFYSRAAATNRTVPKNWLKENFRNLLNDFTSDSKGFTMFLHPESNTADMPFNKH